MSDEIDNDALDDAADSTGDDLASKIAKSPDDVDLYRVYGDLLQGRGDPRGELGDLPIGSRPGRWWESSSGCARLRQIAA